LDEESLQSLDVTEKENSITVSANLHSSYEACLCIMDHDIDTAHGIADPSDVKIRWLFPEHVPGDVIQKMTELDTKPAADDFFRLQGGNDRAIKNKQPLADDLRLGVKVTYKAFARVEPDAPK
jgi:hypothetical protein